MLVAIVLIESPGLIFISRLAGGAKNEKSCLRKPAENWRGFKHHTANAGGKNTGVGFGKKRLRMLPDHGYMNNASLQNNTLRFGTKWPG